MNISNFYSLMPPDNASTIAFGAPINFNQDGPTNNTTITRLSASTFNLIIKNMNNYNKFISILKLIWILKSLI